MLHIHTLTLGNYQTNTYLIYADGATGCAIIDPGYEAEAILAKLRELGLTADAVLLTHGHFDHVGAVEAIVEATGCALWMRESDWSQPNDPLHQFFYPIANCDFTEVRFCEEGETIHAGGLSFRVLETPGHTWGSVCYLCEDAMFSGDTLFYRGCGRTDLPGGRWEVLKESLRRLGELEGNYRVFPGHGESTTLSAERKYNPYIR